MNFDFYQSSIFLFLRDKEFVTYLIYYYTFLINFSVSFAVLCVFFKKVKTYKLFFISIFVSLFLSVIDFSGFLLTINYFGFFMYFEVFLLIFIIFLLISVLNKKTRNRRNVMNLMSNTAFLVTTFLFHTATIDISFMNEISQRAEIMKKIILVKDTNDFKEKCYFYNYICEEKSGFFKSNTNTYNVENFKESIKKSKIGNRKIVSGFAAPDYLYDWEPFGENIGQYLIYTNKKEGYQRYILDKVDIKQDLKIAKTAFFVLALSQTTVWLLGMPILIILHDLVFLKRRKKKNE